MKSRILDDVVESLRDLVCLKCEKSRIGDDESLISRVMGVRTGGMLRRREEYASIGKSVSTMSKKKI